MNKAVTKLRDMANTRARDFTPRERRVMNMLPMQDQEEFEKGKYSDFMTGAMMAALLVQRGANLNELIEQAREVWLQNGHSNDEFDKIHGDWID